MDWKCLHIPGWSSDGTAAFVVDANEGTSTVDDVEKSELGVIGTLENILLIPAKQIKNNIHISL